MLSFLLHTLGCKLNLLESEAFSEVFNHAGFSSFNPEADSFPSVIFINTCTVTSKADQKARRVIRKALREHPESVVLISGCYAKLNQIEIEELSGGFAKDRLFVLKNNDKNEIQNLLSKLFTKKPPCSSVVNSSSAFNSPSSSTFQFFPEKFASHTRSFLKIQDGCDNSCTYCRIRLARGKSVSLESGIALERLRTLEENHSEAVITGVNISKYRDSSRDNLGGLLEFLLEGTSNISLRLSSLAPDCIDENFAGILMSKRIRPHFHLSVQSGSKKILERMGRSYDAGVIEKAAGLLRSVKDDPFLACDIITGFPGEGENEFKETFDLCRKIGFAWIHVFPFSKRPGTPAWSFTDAVAEKEIVDRVKILTELAWSGREEYVKNWLGREVDVLVEGKNTLKSFCHGISENYLKVLIPCNDDNTLLPGTVLRCKLEQKLDKKDKNYDVFVGN